MLAFRPAHPALGHGNPGTPPRPPHTTHRLANAPGHAPYCLPPTRPLTAVVGNATTFALLEQVLTELSEFMLSLLPLINVARVKAAMRKVFPRCVHRWHESGRVMRGVQEDWAAATGTRPCLRLGLGPARVSARNAPAGGSKQRHATFLSQSARDWTDCAGRFLPLRQR